MSGGSGRVLLCYRAGRGMVVASSVGVEVYVVEGGRYVRSRFYPACSVVRVDVLNGVVYLRGDGGPVREELPCRTRRVEAMEVGVE